jgi:hypothetical protein
MARAGADGWRESAMNGQAVRQGVTGAADQTMTGRWVRR